MTELDEALVASMKLVNNKTLMGAYATTRGRASITFRKARHAVPPVPLRISESSASLVITEPRTATIDAD